MHGQLWEPLGVFSSSSQGSHVESTSKDLLSTYYVLVAPSSNNGLLVGWRD